MIGCFNCLITGVRLQPIVQLQLCRVISGIHKGADAPITFEEIVMVMINTLTPTLLL